MIGGAMMSVQVKEHVCYNCKYFKEGYYRYYTYDNRMVECYRRGCQKQLQIAGQDYKVQCFKWEPQK